MSQARKQCMQRVSEATTYLTRLTAAWPDEHLRAAIRRDVVREAALAIDAAVLAEDEAATKAACRQWWRAILREPP